MKGHLIFTISDLHIGRRNRQDSFTPRADAVEAFGRSVAAQVKADTDVTLVLNGDVFDLWELVTDQELEVGGNAAKAIRDGLCAPTYDAPEVDALAKNVSHHTSVALGEHPEFQRMLRSVLSAGVKVHFNVGNHDHRLDNVKTKTAFRDALNLGALASGISIERFYLNRLNRFYAEHGDQFADHFSKPPLSDVNGNRFDDATGFYLLRYVWNRLEGTVRGEPPRVTIAEVASAIELLLRFRPKDFENLITCVRDYFLAVSQGDAVLADLGVLRTLYRIWRADQKETDLTLNIATTEITDAHLRAMRRDLKHDRLLKPAEDAIDRTDQPDEDSVPDVDPGVLVIDPDRSGAVVAAFSSAIAQLPGTIVKTKKGKNDRYAKGLMSRFEIAPGGPFPRLERSQIHTMTVGHTHHTLHRRLYKNGPVYLNSGSWTNDKPMTYVWSYCDGFAMSSGVRKL